jgi:hypothetical protein
MNDLERILGKVKRLRSEKAEAVSSRKAIEKEIQDIADGIPQTALKDLPKNVTDGLTKYRGQKK